MKVELPEFSQVNVLVVGDVMLDRYWHGSSNRISPEAPVPIVNVAQSEDRLGGAANVASNIQALGGQATLIGLVGQDEAADSVQSLLNEQGITHHLIRSPDVPTITKHRVVSHHQQMLRVDFEEPMHELSKESLVTVAQALLATHDLIVLSDYNKGTLSHCRELIELATAQGVPVLVDPKGPSFDKYRGANLLTPNMSEFERIMGKCDSEQVVTEKAQRLLNNFSLSALLLTRSEHGMTLFEPNKPPFHIPTQAQDVFDVTGAGDTVIATMAIAIAASTNLQQAATLSNLSAGIAVGKLGTSNVTKDELRSRNDLWHATKSGVVSKEQLKVLVQTAQEKGERIVMTNGCFDILHAGHVSYLNKAAEMGHRLIVAVNSDDSVRTLKGESRPVNPLAQRMEVLAGLTAVDWVVSFSDDTPQQLIADILPDLLVKGGDYHVDEIAGAKEVFANGGDVQVLNFEAGISTSNIIQVIKDNAETS
ncbi:bifunctional D-glycero-beta-D-manno-heptose-7-phosphate kinase/D-glycero-beta-D-manno-heptose 1-phosphate adenylyltransferase HldE [Thalassotalea agarivorans]|uniref:Bifunctional protein HldE n=1 Tax=Thalassotalea agarivorans TaxID=349064 RepID=A0A1I0HVI7_THASX|nr:bifunctional D-glycero-beta-D-manno-heptose-7-phosphate kinase/D-glycero-beta-D-manno-heptose 1-phosphate adenylyltransferase HldE [Thalassotalea agarivorans]SET87201.1 D-beta-D-heptose 7-phosphate kinase / D-beta-D-heptose 1-phosphate adenosyltransferase [Thalassotalea agarivorans]